MEPWERRLRAYLADQDDLAAAYLFGSRARRDARPDSDLDVAAVFADPRAPDRAIGGAGGHTAEQFTSSGFTHPLHRGGQSRGEAARRVRPRRTGRSVRQPRRAGEGSRAGPQTAGPIGRKTSLRDHGLG